MDLFGFFFFSSRRRHTRLQGDWSSDVCSSDLVRFGRRTAAILRAASLRCGLTPDLERPSTRYGSTPVDGPAKGQAVGEQWEKMVDTWYREVGYDRKPGKPLPATLKALGLDWLAQDLWGKRAAGRWGSRSAAPRP